MRELVLCVLSSGTRSPLPGIFGIWYYRRTLKQLSWNQQEWNIWNILEIFSGYFCFCSLSKLIEAWFFSNVINGWGYLLHWSEGQPLPLICCSQYLIKNVPCLNVRKKDLQRLKPKDGFLHSKHRQQPKYVHEERIIWNCNAQLPFFAMTLSVGSSLVRVNQQCSLVWKELMELSVLLDHQQVPSHPPCSSLSFLRTAVASPNPELGTAGGSPVWSAASEGRPCSVTMELWQLLWVKQKPWSTTASLGISWNEMDVLQRKTLWKTMGLLHRLSITKMWALNLRVSITVYVLT